MKLSVKDLDIATGGVFVCVLNEEDARALDLFALDRVKIKHNKKETTAIVDIAESSRAAPKGTVGLFEEVIHELGVKNKQKVTLRIAEKPRAIQLIKEKLDGKTLSYKEMDIIIKDIDQNKLSDIELTFFVAACYKNGLTDQETLAMTKSIAMNGTTLQLRKSIILDKHCSGGVPGNRTTMVIVPIIAAAGFTIPKTSSRAITSPAGTADTVEVLTNVSLPRKKIEQIVRKTNGCLVWGGGMRLASADDKMIKVRFPLNLDPEGLLLSSILAKKVAVGATHLLADLPIGPDTKLKTVKQGRALRSKFMNICKKLGIHVKVILTDGSQPIGNGIGPALEARDVLWLLQNDKRAPADLKEKSVMMAGMLLEMAGKKQGKKKAQDILESGKAYKKFCDIIKAQGGKNPQLNMLRPGKYFFHALAEKQGEIGYIDCRSISKIARLAGAPKTTTAGIYLYKHVGDDVVRGEKLFTIYAESKEKLQEAIGCYKDSRCFVIG